MCYKNALLFHSEAALYSLPVPSRLLQHVPFRESKLTHYLQSFFCGRGKACMIININQCASMYDETLNVLKFSAVAQKVHTCFIVFVRGLRAALSLQVIPLFGNCANTHPPTHPPRSGKVQSTGCAAREPCSRCIPLCVTVTYSYYIHI